MSLRGKSLRALSLSFVLTAIVAAGFAVSGFARGESSGSLAKIIGPVPQAASTIVPDTPAASRKVPEEWLGRSGRLRMLIDTPTSLAQVVASLSQQTLAPGIHDFGVVTPSGSPFYVLSLLPYATKTGGKIHGYYVGDWPLKPGVERYAQPAGFIEVTEANAQTHVSEQFRLGDFLTHDQANVWPKFLVLKPGSSTSWS